MSDLIAAYTITPLAPPSAPPTGGSSGSGASTALVFYHNARGRGWIPGLQKVGETAHRIGDNGTIAQTMGTVGRPVQIPLASVVTSKALATAFCTAVEALIWTEVSIIDCWTRTIARARITDAQAIPTAARGVSIGGVPCTHRIDCVLTIEILPA